MKMGIRDQFSKYEACYVKRTTILTFAIRILVSDSMRLYLAAINHVCNELGHQHLGTDTECINAVEKIKQQSKVFLAIPNSIGETEEGYPKGCYVNDGVVSFRCP